MSTLEQRVGALFRQQLEAWPRLRTGVEGLAAARTKPLLVDGGEVLARHIPHRRASTTAAVDPASIRARACFLCAGNLDPEERGVPFGEDYTIYCNPFPVVEGHLTIVHREHRPQRLEGASGALLDLAAALPGRFVLYNGPECGASAPDHMHLQAGSSDGLPILAALAAASGPALAVFGVHAVLLRGLDAPRLCDELAGVVSRLPPAPSGRSPEPWCNVVAMHEPGAGYSVIVFPRTRHRPAAFHSGELTVSPAAIDLCGLLVVPVEADFEKLTGDLVGAVYREVTPRLPELRAILAGQAGGSADAAPPDPAGAGA